MNVLAEPLTAPYKGLAPFEDSEIDALLFFGRERESEVIVANLLASKLTVLYGPSGVGKSSILRAGVVRRLREVAPDAEITVLDEWAGEFSLPSPDDEAFLILDQFEEYFLYHDERPLLDQLPALLELPRVHVLFALREDALARLDAFQARIPTVFANRLRLDHLDEAAARAAILGPLDRWNALVPLDERVLIEPALVAAVLADVAAAPDRIEAPYLQLVMERIWDEEREAGSSTLRAQTLRRLGGARAIVSAHLERALGSLPAREAAIATSALRFLVTPSRTKIAHSFGDLVDYTDESPVELQAVLELLASQRILRAVAAEPDGEGGRYEIFHDVLAEPVLAWRREFEARAAVERERQAAAKRQRRLFVFATLATLLAAVMVALTVYAFGQRSEANKQQQVAEQQASEATHQQQVAEANATEAKQQKKRADAQTQEARKQRKAANKSAQAAQASASDARRSRAEAVTQRKIAEREAARFRQAAKAARHNAQIAKGQTLIARSAARRAAAGEDVAQSAADLAIDPVAGIREAVTAATLERTPRVEDALRAALQARRVRGILKGGGGAVNAAVFSKDGSLVATASDGGFLRLFRTATNEQVHSIDLGSKVLKVTFAPDGRTVLAGTSGKRAVLVDVASGKVIESLPTGSAVLDVAFAGGGTLLLTGGADGALRIWDTGGTLLRTLPGAKSVRTLAVNPAGDLVAVVASGDPTARVYRLPSGDLVMPLVQQAEVTDAAFSPSGALLVTTGRRNGYVWNTNDWSLRHLLTGHESAITDVVFASDGRVITSSVDSSARVWNPDTGESLFVLAGAHQQKVLAVGVSPDGTQIATASADETARLWKDLGAIPTILAGHRLGVNAVSYSPDGRYVLTASADGTARLWDPLVPALAPIGAQTGAVSTVSYSPDGKHIVSAGADGTARLWSTTGAPMLTLQHAARVTRASFVDGGREVLTASEDGTAKLWRVSNGAAVATFADGSPLRAAVATPKIVVTAGDDGAIHGWSLGGKPLWTAANGAPVTVAAVHGNVLATGAADGSVRLWRTSNGSLLHVLPGHTGSITSLAFSADGSLLASGSADHTARIWRSDTGALVHRLVGHVFDVTSVAFSPAGTQVLTASVDGDAWLWSVRTGRTVHRLRFHVATVSEAEFSPDGRWVVTAGPSTAGIWQVRTGKLTYYLGGVTGQLLSAGFAPDSERIVVGTSTGIVGTFRCTLCAQTPALLAQARYTLQRLEPSKGKD